MGGKLIIIIINKREESMKKFKCIKCGHEWIPRTEEKPKSCPACKNRKWHKSDQK